MSFTYDIVKRIAVISRSADGSNTLELNRISYNGREAKIDLRRWDHADKRMLKGITLTDEEVKELHTVLSDVIKEM